MLAAAAVSLRILGKIVAFVNAGFLLITSILQFTEVYSSCWCSSAVMSLGIKNSWVVLFATDSQIVAASEISVANRLLNERYCQYCDFIIHPAF